MAKPYNTNYPDCWFSRLLEKKGEDYISSGKITDAEVIRSIDRIIDDIINGKIDYSKYGNCVLHPAVFNNLLSYCREKVSTISAKLYSLSYVNWACDTGRIVVANSNRFPDGDINAYANGFPYDYDVFLLNNGISTITPSMKNTLSIALRNETIEYNKYLFLMNVFDSIQVSQNIYELQWATNGLKQFVRSNNNIIY